MDPLISLARVLAGYIVEETMLMLAASFQQGGKKRGLILARFLRYSSNFLAALAIEFMAVWPQSKREITVKLKTRKSEICKLVQESTQLLHV